MHSPEMKYSHIIWDWNGTLLDDAWLCVEVMGTMLKEHGLPQVDLEKYREIFDFPVKDYYQKLGFDFNKESFEIVGMEFMIRYNQRQKECRLHSGVPELLKAIGKKGYIQCILSAREQNELLQEIRDAGLFSCFSLIFGTDDHYAHGKTDVGLRMLADLGIAKNKILFIGDTLHDAQVATEMGIDCILIPNGHHDAGRLESSRFPVIRTLPELTRML